jgi:hypothetical protein
MSELWNGLAGYISESWSSDVNAEKFNLGAAVQGNNTVVGPSRTEYARSLLEATVDSPQTRVKKSSVRSKSTTPI